MNRRALMGAAAAAAPAALAAPALAQTQMPEVRWRLSSSFPRNLDVLFGTAEGIAQRVAQLTDGKFRISVFPGGEIAPPFAALDAVQSGSVECTHTASYYYVGKDPTFAFFTAMPFGLKSRQFTAWWRHGGAGNSAPTCSANTMPSPSPRATRARRWAAGSATRCRTSPR